jgi:solute carrier family 45 protein 1/2/4
MFFFDTGAILGGHVRAVFTLITFIFTICVALTVTSFKEIPLHLLESHEQVIGDPHRRDGLSSVNAVVTGIDRWTSPEKDIRNSNRCW